MRWPFSQRWATLRLLHILMAVCTAQVEAMLNEGIFDMQQYVDGGWVTGLKYEDEVMDDLKKRTGGKADKLRSVSVCVLHVILHIQNMCVKTECSSGILYVCHGSIALCKSLTITLCVS